MWTSEDYPLRRGQNVREKWVDCQIHQVEDGEDEDEEASEQPHPGVGQEEVEGGAGQAQGPRPPPVILWHGAEGEGHRGHAADVLRPDRDGLGHAQAVSVLWDARPSSSSNSTSDISTPVLAASTSPPASTPSSTSWRVSYSTLTKASHIIKIIFFQHKAFRPPWSLQFTRHEAPGLDNPRPRAPASASRHAHRTVHRDQQTENVGTLRLCRPSVRPGHLSETFIRPYWKLYILFRPSLGGKLETRKIISGTIFILLFSACWCAANTRQVSRKVWWSEGVIFQGSSRCLLSCQILGRSQHGDVWRQ